MFQSIRTLYLIIKKTHFVLKKYDVRIKLCQYILIAQCIQRTIELQTGGRFHERPNKYKKGQIRKNGCQSKVVVLDIIFMLRFNTALYYGE